MKINLFSFNCQFDEGTEKVALIGIDDLKFFLAIHNLSFRDFNPDFVNEKMNEFLFCVENKEWPKFVSKLYDACEVKIVLHDIPAADDFDIYRYFRCNIFVIEYIIKPEYRDKAFLMQVTENIGNKYFIDEMHGMLSNPKTSKISSLYKLKMYWNKLRYDSHLGSFLTRRQSFLTRLSKAFPFTYRSFYFKFIAGSKVLSLSNKLEYIHCSEELVHCIESDEMDFPF